MAIDKSVKRGAGASTGEAIRAALDPLHREHSDLFYTMHEVSRLVSVYFDRAMAAHRLTHAQWWALMHIFEREGLTQTELAELMQMGRASTGKLLERLEAKQWIERRADRTDSRIRRVFLRKEAAPLFSLMTSEARKLFKTFLKGVASAEEDGLVAGLHKIKENAEVWKRSSRIDS